MQRKQHHWYSRALGRDMRLVIFGEGGERVLAFPPSMHPCTDWEERGLVASLASRIEQGQVQLFCLDQVDTESWYGKHLPPAQRARRQGQYDRYLADEVVPFSLEVNPHPKLICAGPSFGAYHATNFAMRHPGLVVRVLGMSGIYDITRFTDGYHDDDVYFNNPVEYIANEQDPKRLEVLRRLEVILAVGRDDPLLTCNQRFSGVLWSKGIWHALRTWDGFAHDWPVWAQMLPLYIGGHD